MFGQGQQHWVIQHLETQQVWVVIGRRLTDQGDIQTTLTQAFELFKTMDAEKVPAKLRDIV